MADGSPSQQPQPEIGYATACGGFAGSLLAPVEVQAWPFNGDSERSLITDASGKQFVLNAENVNRSYNDIEQEHLAIDTLRSRGFTLAVPFLLTSDGKPAYFCHGRYFTLRPYVKLANPFNWRRITWNQSHCAEAGRVLAQLHCSGDGADLSKSLIKRLKPTVDWQEACLERIRFAFARASEFGVMPGYSLTVASAEAIVSRLQGRVEQVFEVQAMIEEWLRAHGSKYAWRALLHGDFHPGNLIFRGSTIKAVIDWDYARLDDPLFDLAYARLMFCGRFREDDFSPEQMFDQGLCESFESSYRDYLDRSQSEHYLWLIVLCSLVMGEGATRQEEAMAADILTAYSEIVLALILVFELEELVKPKFLADGEREAETQDALEEKLQMERNAGNILRFFT